MQNLIAKYLDGSCTHEELQNVDQWIEQNPIEFEQYTKIWEASKEFNYPKNKNSFSLIENRIAHSSIKMPIKPRNQFWKIAASILLLAVFSVFTFTYFTGGDKTEDLYSLTHTSSKEVQEITLLDGTKVWLKPNSSLQVSDVFNTDERNVKLNGAAFFDVAKNAEKSFTINTNGLNVKVLGTSFSVEENSKDIIVSVKTGKVKVSNQTKKTTLLPKQRVTFNKKTDEFALSVIKDSNNWSWVNRVLRFEKTELKDVVSKIEETYKVSIEYNHSFEQTPFTGKFDNAKLDEILSILETSLNVKFKLIETK